MLLRRRIETVEFSEEEVGTAFVQANDEQQRITLIAMANAVDEMGIEGGSWVQQCRAIVDGCRGRGSGLCENDRARIASMLDCLLDHLRKSVASC